MKFELGKQGMDKVTGFTGTMAGFCRYMTGCDQYLLTPRVDNNGKHVESRWFDVNRIGLIAGETIVLDTDEDEGSMDQAPLY